MFSSGGRVLVFIFYLFRENKIAEWQRFGSGIDLLVSKIHLGGMGNRPKTVNPKGFNVLLKPVSPMTPPPPLFTSAPMVMASLCACLGHFSP